MIMKTNIVALLLFSLTVLSAPSSAQVTAPPPGSGLKQTASALPPLPAGVAELKFSEFFVQPIGPRGLELTEKLRGLEGRRVRILGYMAQREAQPPGAFLLTPFPVQVHDHDNSLAEDFPASAVQVSVPTLPGQPVPYAPGLMLLTGTLSIGNRAEPDGRISLVRLALDPPGKAVKKHPGSPARNAGKGAQALLRTSAGGS
jgi:hypothetical protein